MSQPSTIYISEEVYEDVISLLPHEVTGPRSAYIELLCEGGCKARNSAVKTLMRRWGLGRAKVASIMRYLLNHGLVQVKNGRIEAVRYDERTPSAFLEEGGSWSRARQTVFARDGFACVYCGDAQGPFHADHVKPRIQGGTDELANLVTACWRCNLSKGGRTPAEWGGAR